MKEPSYKVGDIVQLDPNSRSQYAGQWVEITAVRLASDNPVYDFRIPEVLGCVPESMISAKAAISLQVVTHDDSPSAS
jgi:hypothetical protein